MRTALLVRLPIVVFSLAITAGLTVEFGRTLNADAVIATTDVVLILLFALCSFWIAFSFVLSSGGFLYAVFGRPLPGPDRPQPGPVRGRTAVVMTIYNEDPSRSLGNLAATFESTRRTGELDAFDFYLLSDTTQPEVAAEELAAWHALCRRLGASGKIFYRRRERNVGAKAGNVADFCKRWGGAYDYMIVLDADSVMDGRTLVSLARIMDANPTAGLVQTQTRCVRRNSLFGRMLQFSGAVYGTVFAAGQALWQGRDGNYWGHNAIIRVAAFAGACGLPTLSGRPPLGGHVLSHDFVEAAFLRRAGWDVWLVPDLNGSYEEAPPTLLDFAKRDQRWCQGNLQHLRILGASGLRSMSRFHMFTGVMAYLSAPLWLIFLFVGLSVALADVIYGHDYFGPGRSLFPGWPAFDVERAQALFVFALGLLAAPRILAILLVMTDGTRRRSFGGPVRLAVSAVLEMLHSALVAPILMVFHTVFVANTLIGRSVGWKTQMRDDHALPWPLLLRTLLPMVVLGAGVLVAANAVSNALVLWLIPVAAGLVLSPLLCRFTSDARLGSKARRAGLFVIPEERRRPGVLREADRYQGILRASRPGAGLREALIAAANPATARA